MHAHRPRKGLEIRAKAASLINLRQKEYVGHRQLIAHAIPWLSVFGSDLPEQCLEGTEASLDPMLCPRSLRFGLGGDATDRAEIVMRLNAAIDDFRKLPDTCAQPRITRQKRRLGEELVEQLDNRNRLGEGAPIDDQSWDDPQGVALAVFGARLLAVQQIHHACFVG